MAMDGKRIVTVGEFRDLLEGLPRDWEITFSGVLEFNRIKKRGEKLIDVEFNQLIYRDSDGRIHLEEP